MMFLLVVYIRLNNLNITFPDTNGTKSSLPLQTTLVVSSVLQLLVPLDGEFRFHLPHNIGRGNALMPPEKTVNVIESATDCDWCEIFVASDFAYAFMNIPF
jgi:hypothetical protein